METIETLVLAFHVLAALAIIGLVLIQHGKGADAGAGFGSGSSGTVFGSGGAGNFLGRMTTVIAIAFFATSFGLAFFAKERSVQVRQLGIPVVAEQSAADVSEVMAEIDEGEFPTFDDPGGESDIPEG